MAAVAVRLLCFCLLVSFSLISYLCFLSYTSQTTRCDGAMSTKTNFFLSNHTSVALLTYAPSWNNLPLPSSPPPITLKIAAFVNRWPSSPAGDNVLERHALALHSALAARGHNVHVFTSAVANATASTAAYTRGGITFHLTPATAAGYLNQPLAWAQYEAESGARRFDVVHTEGAALHHGRARGAANLVASWPHGTAYEAVHSDVAQELLRKAGEPPAPAMASRLGNVVEEARSFRDYEHHVATSDHVGDVLRRVYMVPDGRVHVIVSGADDAAFGPNAARGEAFRAKALGAADAARAELVVGLAGRLVKDKGHAVMVGAIKKVLAKSKAFRADAVFLVAGDGPWAARYKALGRNVVVLGPLDRADELAGFYNAVDVFVNPTLRAQGLDHATVEAMMSGTAVAATRFAGVAGSLIVGLEVGYTFSPTAEAVAGLLHRLRRDGRAVLRNKGEAARARAARLFTARKMAAAYERLFLCVAEDAGVLAGDESYCELSVLRS